MICLKEIDPAGNHLFKVNNRNTKTRYEICSKLTLKTPCSSVSSIVNFEHVNDDWGTKPERRHKCPN